LTMQAASTTSATSTNVVAETSNRQALARPISVSKHRQCFCSVVRQGVIITRLRGRSKRLHGDCVRELGTFESTSRSASEFQQ
jgi:hypothetical protein